ncbi:MAG: hypothetical protein M3290_05070, partial [Actinomycetota bacterium]|nr:hypothetical protein [Actinomycetota bacterium]
DSVQAPEKLQNSQNLYFDDVPEIPARGPLSRQLAVRFDDETMRLLQEAATARGVGVTTLIRSWIQERLGIDWQVGSLATPAFNVPPQMERRIREVVVEHLMQQLPDVAQSVLGDVFDNQEENSETA